MVKQSTALQKEAAAGTWHRFTLSTPAATGIHLGGQSGSTIANAGLIVTKLINAGLVPAAQAIWRYE